MILVGCSAGEGPDSITSQRASAPGAGCTTACHNAQSSISPDPLTTNGSGTNGKHVIHVSGRGIPCEKCHFQYENSATHVNRQRDTENPISLIVYFDSTNPAGAWSADTGPQTGSCTALNCHNAALDWYGTTPWSLPDCSVCHGSSLGTRRQVLGAGGDFGNNNISHHVAGASDPTSAQCKVCHDVITTHMGGTVSLQNADTGANITYDPSDPGSLEPFCLSCHDTAGAAIQGPAALSPFSDGRTLGIIPHEAGNKIESYWNNTYTVHKSNGLTCAGTGAPGTGCHGNNGTINVHGSASKGLLTKSMTLPVLPTPSGQPPAPYDYNDYKLCFDCHDYYPAVSKEVILGYRQNGNYDVWWAPTPYYTAGIQSLFRDRYISNASNFPIYWSGVSQTYNDTVWGDPYTPLHNYHMSYGDAMMKYIWNYRGTTAGRASCITCHNVHGTAGKSVRSTYDEFGITVFTNTFAGGEQDVYKMLVPLGNYEDAVFKAYPVNCDMSCHSIVPGTSYWHTPGGE
jgi:hypothetical protein